ncbi:hypothetical protein ABH931_007148 [Streptacidiphilus sp. MAP12-33]|uniref:hypothetical protein n=1 Tax=Streptacidiphilus sp. MAP12-33 TaxID=3156266 RepID=UPI003518F935
MAGSALVFAVAKAATYAVTVVCDVNDPSRQATGSVTVVTSAIGGAKTGDGATRSFPVSSVAGGAALAVGSLALGAYAPRRRPVAAHDPRRGLPAGGTTVYRVVAGAPAPPQPPTEPEPRHPAPVRHYTGVEVKQGW